MLEVGSGGREMRLLIAGVALLLTPPLLSASPITLFDNGSFSGFQGVSRNNMCAAFDGDSNCTNRFTIYDQFALANMSVITGFEWHQTEQQPQNYMGTLLTIGTGTPSDEAPLFTFLVVADRVLTLIPDSDSRFESLPNGSFEALTTVSSLNIDLDAGIYWLGIHNIFPDPVLSTGGGSSQWSTTLGTTETIAGRWQGETQNCGNFPTSPDGGCLKFFPDENSAFSVIGTVVPEPSTLGLLGAGLLGLVVLRRERVAHNVRQNA